MKVEKKRPVPSPESGPVRHTPGPWSLEYDGSVVIGGQISVGPDSCGPDDVSREERKANCRLIAAAPELLTVCREALDGLVLQRDLVFSAAHVGGVVHDADDQALLKRYDALITACNAAIAKATGGVA